jgi:hypothetical protein
VSKPDDIVIKKHTGCDIALLYMAGWRHHRPSQAVTDAQAGATKSKARPVAACLTHALHDGYTDGLYAFLPVWQAQFGLSYAGSPWSVRSIRDDGQAFRSPPTALLRGLSPRAALILSTVIAATGLLIMALPFGFAGLCIGLVAAGIGSSIQHPRGSMLVTDSYGEASRRRAWHLQLSRAISEKRRCRRSSHCCCRSSPGDRCWA